jgi:hypothetical protein
LILFTNFYAIVASESQPKIHNANSNRLKNEPRKR